MTDILLHLWRTSRTFSTNNAHLMSSSAGFSESSQELFAPFVGSMERFILRLSTNPSTDLFTVTFKINGVVKRTIQVPLVGQTGIFLPVNQLPLFFNREERLVMQITGISAGSFPIWEIDCDLKFIVND